MRSGSLTVLAVAAAVLVTGCASTKAEKPAVCDGKHRRPANAYGSVLLSIPLPGAQPSAPAASPPDAAKLPPATPGPLSRLDAESFAPCGRPA